MWRGISKCCYVILWVLATTAGLASYGMFYSMPFRARVLSWLHENAGGGADNVLQIVATCLICLALLALLAGLRLCRKQAPLTYHTAEGPVVIEPATLNRFIVGLVNAYEGVRYATIKTVKDDRKVNVIARVYLNDSHPVAALVADIQLGVRQRVLEAFGLDLLRDIRIEVARVVARPRRLLSLHEATSADQPESTLEDAPGEIPPSEQMPEETP